MAFIKTADQAELTRLHGGPARHILGVGGSRSGKTTENIRDIIIRAQKAPGSRHCAIRRHFRTAKRAIWKDTLPFVMRECFPGLKARMNNSECMMELPNGSEFWINGLDDDERAERILGTEYATMFFNEISELSYDSVVLAHTRLSQQAIDYTTGKPLVCKGYYDCNPPTKSHWSYKLFVQGIDPQTNDKIRNPNMYKYMFLNPEGNRANLPEGYIEDILENLPERQRKRFLEGLFLDDVEGALWTRGVINEHRVPECKHNMARIVVGVDPAVSNTDNSDLTGIVVVGESVFGDYYVFRDESLKATPHGWASEVVDIYDECDADFVIAEVNNGGDLVESNIHNANPNIKVKKVRATRGKMVRAEPIAGLYEMGKVHHVGEFPELEDEMCCYTGDPKEKSPDRMDALVWALTALTQKGKRRARA